MTSFSIEMVNACPNYSDATQIPKDCYLVGDYVVYDHSSVPSRVWSGCEHSLAVITGRHDVTKCINVIWLDTLNGDYNITLKNSLWYFNRFRPIIDEELITLITLSNL